MRLQKTMQMIRHFLVLSFVALLAIAACFACFSVAACTQDASAGTATRNANALSPSRRKASRECAAAHFRRAERGSYFSADDKYLTFQHQGQFYDPHTGAPCGPDNSLRPDLHDPCCRSIKASGSEMAE